MNFRETHYRYIHILNSHTETQTYTRTRDYGIIVASILGLDTIKGFYITEGY